MLVLQCNDKHYFHKCCINEWVSSGSQDFDPESARNHRRNWCPYCGYVIMTVERSEGEEERDDGGEFQGELDIFEGI